jgi:hypothetical protein
MFNFSNNDYLSLLLEIIDYFKDKEYFGFDDTIIRFDENLEKYIASVYLLDVN